MSSCERGRRTGISNKKIKYQPVLGQFDLRQKENPQIKPEQKWKKYLEISGAVKYDTTADTHIVYEVDYIWGQNCYGFDLGTFI